MSSRPALASSILAAAVFAILAAGCGAGSSGVASVAASTTSTTGSQSGAVAFARCMRSHGAPNWPDPTSGGVFDKSKLQQLGINPTRVRAIEDGPCNHLLPATGEDAARDASAAGHQAGGRALVRAVRAQPRCEPLPRSDRAGSADGRDGPGPGHRRAFAGRPAGRAGLPARFARGAHDGKDQRGTRQRPRLDEETLSAPLPRLRPLGSMSPPCLCAVWCQGQGILRLSAIPDRWLSRRLVGWPGGFFRHKRRRFGDRTVSC